MASKNDGILSNSYDTTNAIHNCNNNETERPSSSTTSSTITITTHHNNVNNQQNYGSLSPSATIGVGSNVCSGSGGGGGGIQQQQQQNQKSDITSRNLDRNFSGGDTIGDYKNIRATISNEAHPIEQQTRREENPFSFKHFLNRDTSSASLGSSSNKNIGSISSCSGSILNSIGTNKSSLATATITVTTSSTVSTASSSAATATAFSNNETNFINSTNSNNNSNSNNSEELNNSTYSKNSKILNDYEIDSKSSPSSKTISTTTTSSTHISSSSLSNSGHSPSMSNKTSTGARPKIPQSATISSTSNNNHYPMHNQQQQSSSQHQQHSLPPTSISITSMSSLIGSGGGGGGNGGNTNETCKMKRSPRFSSFDSQASLAEYAGSGLNDYYENKQQYVHRTFFSNYDMDLPPKNCNNGSGLDDSVISQRRRNSPTRSNRSSTSGLPQSSLDSKNYPLGGGSGIGGPRPNSEFSNVLPDFVQDHYMDQWYYNDINLSSPPNSPISSPVDFIEDLPCGAGGNSGVVSGNNSGIGGLGNLPNTIEKCQTLPDFLSDGPIIHSSSARLADIAAGLPPDLDSPEDNSPSLQLARLRLENDRLRRELDESRLALAEQTRRNCELERRLEQARSNETAAAAAAAAYNRNLTQNSNRKIDENLEQSKKRDAAAQSQISKLKQQIKQLTAEVDTLRRENESLREDGAVGGDRVTRRPSRTQQLSRDLMRAASNAENNLRQLLSGVENLRLMAATIENMDRIAIDSTNQANSNINDEFLSDSDVDLDDFTGPAL